MMITTLTVSGASLNLHHACADFLFIEVPDSANKLLQALQRVFRLGQEKRGNIVIMTPDHPYDRPLQAKAPL